MLDVRTAEGSTQPCQEIVSAATTELLTTTLVNELVTCGSQSIPELINIYQDTRRNPLERMVAVRALGRIPDQAAVAALSEIVQSSKKALLTNA